MMLNLVYKGLGNSLTLRGFPPLRQQPDLHHLHTQYIDSTLSPSRLRLPDFQLIVPESKQHSNMPVLAPPSMQPTPLLLHHNPSWFLQWCHLNPISNSDCGAPASPASSFTILPNI